MCYLLNLRNEESSKEYLADLRKKGKVRDEQERKVTEFKKEAVENN